MPDQSAERVLAAMKVEGTYGTPESSGSGAEQIRLLDSAGLKLTRGEVPSEERPTNQIERAAMLGGHEVGGVYNTEVNPGGYFDILMGACLRATPAALAQHAAINTDVQLSKATPAAVPVNTGYTIEQNDMDIDDSELFYGVRVTEAAFTLPPRQRAKVAWTMKGLSRNIVGTGASPWFTSPNLETGDSLIVDSATISYAGSPITTLTDLNFSIVIASAMQDFIGGLIPANVFLNLMTAGGAVSALRQDLTALTAFDAETEFAILANLVAPGTPPQLTFAVNLPRVKIFDIDAPFLGGDAGKIETRTFKAYPAVDGHNIVELYSSTETPTAYS